MVGVGREEPQKGRSGVGRIARRDVELVGGDDAKLRIAEFPPVLVADYGDIEAAAGLGASWIAWMTRAVARNSVATISAGITVQASSICVLP